MCGLNCHSILIYINIMKESKIENIEIKSIDINNAFDNVFNQDTLYKLHGIEQIKISAWQNNQRIVKFRTKIDNIPLEVRRFFCGKELKVTNRQIITESTDTYINIRNKIRMHFLGAEIFHVKPYFYLQKIKDKIYFSARIENHAILPPPLNSIAENFMAAKSQKELESFAEALTTSTIA